MDSSRYAFLVLLCGLVTSAAPPQATYEPATHRHIANVSHSAGSRTQEGLPSIFSPRMDFEQWKPLTGRGDPLRNDPTYDYEPPVLERVHYWADEPRPDREHRPERKSEVLMLGVSSRKPSVAPRQPPRRPHRPSPPNYEEFVYKLSKHYPMTILVPPPPPPPGHKLPLFILHEETPTTPTQLRTTEPPLVAATSEPTNKGHTSLYHLQEANLIYQSSTTSQNWADNKGKPNMAVSSDYAGWGPTTPIDEDPVNDTHNLIFNDHFEMSKHPFSFYRPMLSEAPPPPPPHMTPNPLLLPSFVPTALPPATTALTTPDTNTETEASSESTTEVFETETTRYQDEDETTSTKFAFRPTSPTPFTSRPEKNFFGMLNPMMSMPLVNGAERPEDHLYAHASENIHIYKEQQKDDTIQLESMQTMQPPPPSKATESSIVIHKRPFHVNPHILNNPNVKQSSTLDPYIHMRFTNAIPTVASMVEAYESTTTEAPAIPTYLIIQGHSKVKTYSSKPKHSDDKESIVNEIPKPNESSEVRHLHPLKEKNMKKVEKSERYRANSARSLKSLLDEGVGSIEIQEANVGIKYDVSDGSDVPLEIYRKGIVESDENDYPSRNTKLNRPKRQISLTDLLPFDEDQVEDFVYNFLKGRKNETGITGLIAQAVTSETADIIDDDDDEDEDEEDR